MTSDRPAFRSFLCANVAANVVLWAALSSGIVYAQGTSPSPSILRAPVAPSAHRVTAGDVLMIWVYGDTGLTGAFPVGAEGTIGYPILGNVAVADKTTGEIGAEIALALAVHVPNLSVAVTVKEYAPIFIVGEIQKPGKYEFRPGMIALELFALSGGLREAATRTDMSGVQLIAAQQDYEDMALQLLGMEIRQVRLEAELNDTPFEPKIAGIGRDPVVVQQIVNAESGIHALRLAALKSEQDNLKTQRQNYAEEIETLTKTGAMRNEQFELLRMDVEAAQALVAKGAGTQAALRERKRDLLAMNQQLLEFGSFLARARQNKSEVERRLQELTNDRHNKAATELRDMRLDMLRLRQKMAFSGQTMAEIGLAAKRINAMETMIDTEFSLVRLIDGTYRESVINEHTVLQSGDVVRVALVPRRAGERAASASPRRALQ